MNVADTSLDNWLRANASSSTTLSSNKTYPPNATYSSSTTIPLNATDSSSASSYPDVRLWDMRWFGLLSAPLLFTTILLPLFAGPIIRYVTRASVKVGVFWRLTFVLLGAGYITGFYALHQDIKMYIVFFTTCDIPLMLYVGYLGYRVYEIKTWRAIWRCAWIGSIAFICFMLDSYYNFAVVQGSDEYTFVEDWQDDFKNDEEGLHILYGIFAWLLIFIVRLISYSRVPSRQARPKVDGTAGDDESHLRLVF